MNPDFVFTYSNGQPLIPMVVGQCGMVCWGHVNPPLTSDASQYTDCVAYLNYRVNSGHAAANPMFAGNPTLLQPGDGTMSLTRILMDPTPDNATDFALRPPSAMNNAGGCFGAGCSTTTTTVSGGTTTTAIGSTTTTTFPPGLATPVAGAKLVLKTSPKSAAKKSLAVLARDAAITLGDPVAHGGGSLRVFTTAGDAFDHTYLLPAARWKPIGKAAAPKGFRYSDPRGAIRLVIVKQGKIIKIGGAGGQLMQSLAANPDPVHVFLAAGTEAYCALFQGGKFAASKRYVAGPSSAPVACP